MKILLYAAIAFGIYYVLNQAMAKQTAANKARIEANKANTGENLAVASREGGGGGRALLWSLGELGKPLQ